MRFLVTAGNTREKIDRVRDWGNIFTGNTGYSIAKALSALGDVDLMTSNRGHLVEIENGGESAVTAKSRGMYAHGSSATARLNSPKSEVAQPVGAYQIRGISFHSHEELKASLEAALKVQNYDAIFMTAAIADYRPVGAFQVVRREIRGNGEEEWIVRNVQAGKIKSSYDEIAILGARTEKLVDLFRSKWGYQGLLVKFKLEVGVSPAQLIQVGQASRKASGAEYLVANTLEMVEGDRAGAYLLSDAGEEWVSRGDLPGRLCKLAQIVK